jgi:hypothetical protein
LISPVKVTSRDRQEAVWYKQEIANHKSFEAAHSFTVAARGILESGIAEQHTKANPRASHINSG